MTVLRCPRHPALVRTVRNGKPVECAGCHAERDARRARDPARAAAKREREHWRRVHQDYLRLPDAVVFRR